MTLDSKFDIESTLYSVGYILVCMADIFKIEWLNYAAICCASAAIILMIMIICQYRKLQQNTSERKKLKKTVILKSVFSVLLLALCIFSAIITF